MKWLNVPSPLLSPVHVYTTAFVAVTLSSVLSGVVKTHSLSSAAYSSRKNSHCLCIYTLLPSDSQPYLGNIRLLLYHAKSFWKMDTDLSKITCVYHIYKFISLVIQSLHQSVASDQENAMQWKSMSLRNTSYYGQKKCMQQLFSARSSYYTFVERTLY